MENNLLLIDTFYFLHRSFHAYPLELKNSKGIYTNIVYGFALSLLDSIIELNPMYIACGWESEELPSFRKTLYPQYQATRVSMEPDEEMIFSQQLPYVIKLIEAFNIPRLSENGFEGDDVLGTAAEIASKEVTVIISTTDFDMTQLINYNVKIFKPARAPYIKKEIVDIDSFFAKYGFKPHQVIDYKALRGDPSDNIPGVKGIGEKTATSLIKKYKDLDNIYKNIDEIIPPSLKDKLIKDKDNAYLSKQLATIITNIPMDFKLENCLVYDYDFTKVKKVFDELEFKSLNKKLEKLESILNIKREMNKDQKPKNQFELF